MRSPGRPRVAGRAEQQRFWKAIARGLSSEDAAVSCGVSPPVGGRWFREGGGMPPISLAPPSARYLSFAEREEIAILSAQGAGVRDIARRVRRAPSTVSRELRRNAATRSGGLAYRASTAQWHSHRRAKRPKIAKLATNDRLRRYVQDRLAGTVRAEDGRPVPGPHSTADRGRRSVGGPPPKSSTNYYSHTKEDVLRRPFESGQYLSMRYTDRLMDASIAPSVGSQGDAYDNDLAESVIGLYKTEVIRRKGPWRTPEAVEFATLTWVDWFNTRRLLGPLGDIPPAEYEAHYYAQAAVA